MKLIFWIFSIICVIGAQSKKGIIVGPKTPLFNLEYPLPNYLKVEHIENVFEESEAYNYYREPSNRDGIIFLRILVVCDFYLYPLMDDEYIINKVLEKWNEVDDYFTNVQNAKIKIIISGVVNPKVRNIWNNRELYAYMDKYFRDRVEVECYDQQLSIRNIKNWFANNTDNFEKLSYDLLIYMSKYPFLNNDKIFTYATFNDNTIEICSKNDNDFSLYGGIVHANKFFSFYATKLIAQLMGVPIDESKCGKNTVMDPNWDPENSKPKKRWSQCSEEAFKNIASNPQFNCLKKIKYEEDENDYDN